MGENDARHEEARGPTRRGDSAARRFRIFLSVSETWKCHRRVGRVGPEHRSSRRGRGEQRRPLRRHVGNVGACPPPLRGRTRSAVVAQNAAMYLFGQTIELYVDFDLTAAWRHRCLHAAVKLEPVCGDHSAQKGTLRAFQSQAFGRNPRLVDFGALWAPYLNGKWLVRREDTGIYYIIYYVTRDNR